MNICFLCPNERVSLDFVTTVLELRGIPDKAEEKKNILKVICQLLRVKWATVEPIILAEDDSVVFPFCSFCLKLVVDLIYLREQLCQLESDIREKLKMMEVSVAQFMDNTGSTSADVEDDWEEGKMELPESYEDYRKLFQKQVMREHLNKILLEEKIEELNQNETKFAIQFIPSIVQLKLQKNVFKIIDASDVNGVNWEIAMVPATQNVQETDDKKKQTLVQDPPKEMLELDDRGAFNKLGSGKIHSLPVSDLVPTAPCARKLDFGCIKKSVVEETELSDDSDYGSPSKKLKIQTRKVKRNQKQLGNQTGSQHFSSTFDPTPPECSDGSESSASDEASEGELSDNSESSEHEESDEDGIESEPHVPSFTPIKQRRRGPTKEAPSKSPIRLVQPEGTFSSKNGTQWTTEEPQNIYIKAFDVQKEDGGLRGAAKAKLTPVETFKLFFPPSMIDLITKYTNEFAEHHTGLMKEEAKAKDKEWSDWKPLSRDEIYAYIGILLYLGTEKKRQTSIMEIWGHNEKYMLPPILATMSRDRFSNIQKFIRFDDRVARAEKQTDGIESHKLNYISEVFDPFVESFDSYFCPFDNLVVDEMLVKYRGTVKFRVYMKSKPGKYGIKIWALCDATTGYILRISIYEGKVGDKVEMELGKKVVLSLVQRYFKTGRTVTTDNFFTSKALADELLKEKMYLLGTLNKNRMDIIPKFADGSGREVESSMFAFNGDHTMVSYVPRKNKTVVLLSTFHHTAQINPDVKNKPQMILDYNKTKGGVDTADFMIANTSCQRRTSRWPMKLFQAMLDIGAVNAFIIWKISNSDPEYIKERQFREFKGTRRGFLKAVSEGLMEPVIEARSQIAYRLQMTIRRAIEIMGFEVTDPNPSLPLEKHNKPKSREWKQKTGGCRVCAETTKLKRAGANRCGGCLRWICAEHSRKYVHCYDCEVRPFVIYQEKRVGKGGSNGSSSCKVKSVTAKVIKSPQNVKITKQQMPVLKLTKQPQPTGKRKREPVVKKKKQVEPLIIFGI